MDANYLFKQILECVQVYGDDILPKKFWGLTSNPALQDKFRTQFLRGRKEKHPEVPSTEPDGAFLDVMSYYYSCPYSADLIIEIHKKAMASENIVGDILERYIASVLEPHNWVWASGSVLRAIDFIYQDPNGNWTLLQVKNRDNSENSSSSAIRNGTPIKKWFRSFSRKKSTNWPAFPVPQFAHLLSEDAFRKFLIAYVSQMKTG